MLYNPFFFENRAVYEIKRKSIVQRDKPQMTTWRMRVACWLTKATHTHIHTHTHTQYVILTVFPLQQRLQERASMIRYMYEMCSESIERFAIQRYLLIIGKKQNMQVLSHTFTYFST